VPLTIVIASDVVELAFPDVEAMTVIEHLDSGDQSLEDRRDESGIVLG
jgi:hypothetical protein